MTENTEITLDSLMVLVKERHPLQGSHYRHSSSVSLPEEQEAFAVSHALKHLMKSVGVIATHSEAYDHGKNLDHEVLRIATTKILVNALALANTLHMQPHELAAQVPQVMLGDTS